MRTLAGFTMLIAMLATRVQLARGADKPVEPPTKASSLDDELLKGLGGDDLLIPSPKKKPAKPAAPAEDVGPTSDEPRNSKPGDKPPTKPTARRSADALDDELLKGLESGAAKGEAPQSAEAESDNPLIDLNRRMREVQRRMLIESADDETVAMQREIVRKIDELIKQAEQQQSSSSKSSSPKQRPSGTESRQQQQPGASSQPSPKPSEQPARDSNDKLAKRKPQQPDMAQMRELLKDIWGELPPRLRQQMMQSSVEKFVPKYELLIEEYFKTLADEQSGADRR